MITIIATITITITASGSTVPLSGCEVALRARTSHLAGPAALALQVLAPDSPARILPRQHRPQAALLCLAALRTLTHKLPVALPVVLPMALLVAQAGCQRSLMPQLHRMGLHRQEAA